MSPHLRSEIEALRALPEAERATIREWIVRELTEGEYEMRVYDVVRTPEEYEAFDPAAHDHQKEIVERWAYELWQDDLRRLQSEADAERVEARRAEEAAAGPSPFTLAREAFEAADPRPPHTAPPEVQAEWDWREREHYLRFTDQEDALKAHLLERGSYIERRTEMHGRNQQWADAFFAPLREAPPRREEDEERPPWPPEDGDVVTPILGPLDDDGEEDDDDEFGDDRWERAERRLRRRVPAYAAADDLWAASLGWLMSLPKEANPLAMAAHKAISEFASDAQSAAHGDVRPGTIGDRLLKLRRALPKAQEAFDELEPLLGSTWMTGPAYACLYTMIVEARAALQEHQRAMQSTYEAFREVALRLLGGTKDD